MIAGQWRELYAFIRKSLPKLWSKEFLIFLFFLVLSGIFWLMMTLNETYEQDITVRVELVDVPDNVVITTEPDSVVVVTVSDKGYTLASYMHGARLATIRLPFRTYADDNKGYGRVTATDIEKLVYKALATSSKVTALKTESLEFYFNYGISKEVPVTFGGEVFPAQSHYLAATLFSTDKVTVYADKETIDTIVAVRTEYVRVESLVDTVELNLAIRTEKGMKSVPATVKVTLCPDILTEESVKVPITPTNVPDGIVVRLFPASVTVRFIVGTSVFRSVKAEQFVVEADYNDIVAGESAKCPLRLVTKPQTVRNARTDVDAVDYVIEEQ